MTQEEKARAYDEALERARIWQNHLYEINDKDYADELNYIFPELEEFKDERIRKAIITYISHGQHCGVSNADMISWLEKISEQSHNDKTEPKFKVGDWVVNKLGDLWHIDSFDKKNYQVSNRKGNYNYFPISKQDEMHLWTINDAKEGDIVVDKSDGTIGIFESIGHHPDGGSCNDPSYCFLHCRYDGGFFYADFEHGNMIYSDDLIPATKEQRDLLFAKMKEAGYEWDAEKKELQHITIKQ